MQAGIVGAGILGRLLAFALHNAGWQVTLFDQHPDDNNCSAVAAGLLTPISELDRADLLIFRLGNDALTKHWPRILQQLPQTIYFRQLGSIVLSHPNDQAEWMHFNRRIESQLQLSESYLQCLQKEALVALEPALTKFDSAYYFSTEGQIDCQKLLFELRQYLLEVGVRSLMGTRVLELQPNRVYTDKQSYEFDLVFDCRGLAAKNVFSDLRPIRGELIWVHAPEVQLHRPIRLLHPRYSLYIVPRPDNIYLIGASEIEAEDYSDISVRTMLELLTAAYFVHAGFAEARIIKTATQCRPTLSNNLPRIKYKEGLVAVNGLYRHGYLIAPALVEEIILAIKNKHDVQYPEIWEGR